MNILVVHNFYRQHHIGGEDSVVQNEVAALEQYLGKNRVFTYFTHNDQMKLLPLCKNIWGNKTHADKIGQLIEKNNIQLLHAHNVFPLLTPLFFKTAHALGCKTVQTLHNFRQQCLSGVLYRGQDICTQCVDKSFKWPGVVHACYRGSRAQSLLNAAAQFWYQVRQYDAHIDYYFTLTQFQKKTLIDVGMPPHKLIDKPNFVQTRIEPLPAQHKSGFCFIGRLESGKGIELLLKIWKTLPEDYQLQVVGTGEDQKRLEEIYQSPHIHFMGKLSHDETMQVLNRAQYLLHTSLYFETFGLTMVEAMSLGVPVIGFQLGTRPEFIRHQENGFLCMPESLRETILLAKAYPDYNYLSQQAMMCAKQYQSSAVMPAQIQRYEQILRGTKG